MSRWASKSIALAAVIAVCLNASGGCGSKNSPSSSGQRLHGDTSGRHFELAMQGLGRLDEFDDRVLSNRVVNDLNHWIEDQPEDPDWKADELLGLLPRSYKSAAVPTHGRLEEMSFGYDDFDYLRQAIWARNVASWVSEQTYDNGFEWFIERVISDASENERAKIEGAPDQLLAAIEVAHPELSPSDAARLTNAVRLFDWTIRNVQLQELHEFTPVTTSTQKVTQPSGVEQVEFRWSFPAQSGVVGPGYTYQPWESMLYGQGDAWQRARVFIQLARQLDITVVMLAFDEPNGWRPWVPAVFLGGELFLMDSGLGLPLPSFEGPGIATLKELVATPDSVRAWDVPKANDAAQDADSEKANELIRYPVNGEDLSGVAVLIDAEFPALSKRMVHLQRALVGDDRLVLTVRPSEMAPALRACKGVKDVRLWTVPFDALMYGQALKESSAVSEEARLLRVRRTRMYGEVNDLTQGRHLHFQGRLRADRQARRSGAIDLYQKANRTDEQIWMLVHNNQRALEAMADQPQRDSRDELEAPAFSTTDDPTARRVPEAKWLGIDGLERALEENDIEVSDEQLKQILESELYLKAMHGRYWMALALYELNSIPDSGDWLRRLQDKFEGASPWDTGSRYNLARAYEAMGDLGRATKLYERDTSPQRAGSIVRRRLLQSEVEPSEAED